MPRSIYLDYAAATPLDQEVHKAMQPYLTSNFYNPSATYLAGRAARRSLEESRANVAAALGAKPPEIIFTAGATEANNLAIQGVMKQYPKGEIIISAVEHESVLEPAKLFKHKITPVDSRGVIDVASLEKLINNRTALISVILVNNETGVIQPIKEISALLRKVRNNREKQGIKQPIYLHTDAAQAGCYLDLHTSRLGVDLLSLNSGKIYGPKQTGALYIKTGTQLQPLILGGGQERGLRSGTENLANYAGLAVALKKAGKLRHAELKRVEELRSFFIEGMEQLGNAKLNGSLKHSTPHIVSITFTGIDNERLMIQLDEAGVQAAVGSACSAANLEPSHALKAMGLAESQIHSSLRFSFGRSTTKKDIQATINLLKRFTLS